MEFLNAACNLMTELKLWQDMRLALGLAESVSQSTPIAAAANELYKVAKSHGLSDEDFSAVVEALKAKQWKEISIANEEIKMI